MQDGQQSTTLTAKLQKRLSEQLDAAGSLTQQQLTQLAATLKQQCESALSTTDSVIGAQRTQLRELQHEALATAEALKQTLTTARSITLSQSDQSEIRTQLTSAVKSAQAEAITEALKPLKSELAAVKREAEALSRTTAKSWLKPLLLGVAVLIGTSVAAGAGLVTADILIAKRAETLQTLNAQIADQQMTLTRLQGQTWGIDLRVLDGQQYIVLPAGRTTDGKRWSVGDRQALRMD